MACGYGGGSARDAIPASRNQRRASYLPTCCGPDVQGSPQSWRHVQGGILTGGKPDWLRRIGGYLPPDRFVGADAYEFRPKRWLEAETEEVKRMEGRLELIFRYGKWECLGRNVAMMELQKVLVEV
ncbi:hypothetical protein LZ32DRAFT_672897, partial [Colletotrichum eremochloae]